MSICSEKSEWRWNKMQEKWHLEILNKISSNDIAKYDFEKNHEWSIGDYEQSPLCQFIWGEIICDYLREKYSKAYEYSINRYYLTIISQDNNEKFRFLFDIMNNPQFDNLNYQHRIIGNFTPIPGNWKCEKGRSLQFKHRDFNEDWIRFLKYLKENWSVRNQSSISFEQYIEMTMQKGYYIDNNFVEFKKKDVVEQLIKNRGILILGIFKL